MKRQKELKFHVLVQEWARQASLGLELVLQRSQGCSFWVPDSFSWTVAAEYEVLAMLYFLVNLRGLSHQLTQDCCLVLVFAFVFLFLILFYNFSPLLLPLNTSLLRTLIPVGSGQVVPYVGWHLSHTHASH